MKFIQSWWDIQNKGTIPEKDIPIIELSRLTIEYNLDTKITFYTDLKSLSGLNYTNVEPLDMTGYPKEMWCLGKLVAISKQTEPFIHMDIDMFIWNKFSLEKFNVPFMVFHHEDWDLYHMQYSKHIPPPPTLKKGYDDFNSKNFGMVGGTEWRCIVDTANEILEHVKKYQDVIVELTRKYEGDNVSQTPVLIEQVWMSEIMRKKGIKAKSFLGDKDSKFNPFYSSMSRIYENACKLGVSHYWGHSKRDRYNEIVDSYNKWKHYIDSLNTINNESFSSSS